MSDTVELERESLRLLIEEAQSVVDAIDDPEWHDFYGDDVAEAIQDAQDALSTSTNDADELDVYQYEDWTQGEPCPECGETRMNVVQASGEEYESERGDFEYMDHTPYLRMLKISCDGCDTTLYEHPANALLE